MWGLEWGYHSGVRVWVFAPPPPLHPILWALPNEGARMDCSGCHTGPCARLARWYPLDLLSMLVRGGAAGDGLLDVLSANSGENSIALSEQRAAVDGVPSFHARHLSVSAFVAYCVHVVVS